MQGPYRAMVWAKSSSIPVLRNSKPSTRSAPARLSAPIMCIIHCKENRLATISVGGKYKEEGGENVSFTTLGQKQGVSLETWLLSYSRVYHGHFRTPATPLIFHSQSYKRKIFPSLCQNWRYIKLYILSNCELSGKSFNHINRAPIANVFTVITSIYYVSKDTIVCKNKQKSLWNFTFTAAAVILTLSSCFIFFWYALFFYTTFTQDNLC